MLPLQSFAPGVLVAVVRRQPASPARTAFVWQLAVGPMLARATSVTIDGGVLRVSSADTRWLREIARAKATILARVREIVGDEVTRLHIDAP